MTKQEFCDALARKTKRKKAVWKPLPHSPKYLRCGFDCPLTFVFGVGKYIRKAQEKGMSYRLVNCIIEEADGKRPLSKMLKKACGLD